MELELRTPDAAGILVLSPIEAATVARDAQRVAIVGPPGAGKTTLADMLGRHETLHTDTTNDQPWPVQRAIVAAWAAERDRWVIEGIVAARCLRHREIAPDLVLWCRTVHVDRGARAVALGRQADMRIIEWAAGWGDSPARPALVEVRP